MMSLDHPEIRPILSPVAFKNKKGELWRAAMCHALKMALASAFREPDRECSLEQKRSLFG